MISLVNTEQKGDIVYISRSIPCITFIFLIPIAICTRAQAEAVTCFPGTEFVPLVNSIRR